MAIFQYRALRDDGKSANGIIAAESPREAREKLRQSRLHPSSITPLQAETRGIGRKLLHYLARPPGMEHLATFTRELATLLEAGIPLTDGLGALAQQSSSRRLQTTALDLRERIVRGESFSFALSAHPDWFDDLYVSIVAAAEVSGSLDATLGRLADYVSRKERVRSRVSAALAYPAMMISVSICVLIFLLAYVVPRIVSLFDDPSLLPLPTRILMTLSGFFGAAWPAIIGAVVLLYIAIKLAVNTPAGGRLRDLLLLRLPLVGELVKRAAIARFAVTFSSLLRSGVPAHEALLIVKSVIGNRVIAEAVGAIHRQVLEGNEMSSTMHGSGLFPPSVAQMVAVGERSGRLPYLLERIADAYEEYVEIHTQKLTSLLEPVIIVLMAFVVAYIVLSVLLPILRIGLAVGA